MPGSFTMPAAAAAPLLALVLLAAVMDLRSRRIPNWLSGVGILAGLALHAVLGGWSGLRFAGAGLLTGFSVYFLLYLLRALGAGDVKLMAAVGTFAGVSAWFQIFLATALVGAAAAVLLAAAKGKLGTTLWNTSFIAGELLQFRAPYLANSKLDVKNAAALTLPHGIAIAAGVFIVILTGKLT